MEGQGLKEGDAIGVGQQQCLLKEQLASWVGKFQQCKCTHQFSLNLNINKNEWLKNLPMSGENKARMKHMKTLFENKTNCLP